MLMPTKDRQAIYEYIFEEGVMVAKKGIDFVCLFVICFLIL